MEMTSLYDEMQNYARGLGHENQEEFYEYYINDDTYGKERLLTKIVMLLD